MTHDGSDRFDGQDGQDTAIEAWLDAMDEALWAGLLAHPGRHWVFTRMAAEATVGPLLLFPCSHDLGVSPDPSLRPDAQNAPGGLATSWTTEAFRTRFDALPADVRSRAHAVHQLLQQHVDHSSLRFQEAAPEHQVWSVRIARFWRALVRRTEPDITWLWIGRNDDFMDLLTQR